MTGPNTSSTSGTPGVGGAAENDARDERAKTESGETRLPASPAPNVIGRDGAEPAVEQGSTAVAGEVEESSTDRVPARIDTGNASQLPGAEGAERKASGVPAPQDIPDVESLEYRQKLHEEAERQRQLGHGSEPPRFNPGATP